MDRPDFLKEPLIISSPTEGGEAETEAIRLILSASRYACVHIRKPGFSDDGLRRLLDRLCRQTDPRRLTLHYRPDLAAEYALGGYHGTEELPASLRRSRSAHSIEEIADGNGSGLHFDYWFLSPIFDSISKSGYGARFDRQTLIERLPALTANRHVVALGGIGSDNIGETIRIGFSGAAVLGSVWGADGKTFGEAPRRFEELLRVWEKANEHEQR